MAIKKDLTLDNGIVLNYHRVVSVNNITNQQSIIEVASYINEEQRNKEKEWYETKSQNDMNVFINTSFYSKEYEKELNVDAAYEYLKTLVEFKDAEDI
jgi:hypothetical protein